MYSGRKFIKNIQRIFQLFLKKKRRRKVFYKLKKLKQKAKKIIFMKFAPKRFATKWASPKWSCHKVVYPPIWDLHIKPIFVP